MRIALYAETFLPQVNGIVKVICRTLDYLADRNIEAVIVTPQTPESELKAYAGAQIIYAPSLRNWLYPNGRVGLPSRQTVEAVKAFKPDLIHIFHPTVTGFWGQWHATQLAIPTVSSFHLDLDHAINFYRVKLISRMLRALMRWEFNRSDLALAPSERVQRQMIELGIHHVGLWRRGVDAEAFHPRFASAEMRTRLTQGHPEDPLLLYVGRLAPEKQVHQLRAILERLPQARLAIIGTGALEAELKQYFAGTRAHFVGQLNGAALASAYASSDVMVFPSAFESFGLVILESLACGTPVVSSRVGGAPAVILPGTSGYLFDVNDVEAMITGVQTVLSDPARHSLMRLGSRQGAERHAWATIMDELVKAYDAVIDLAQHPSGIYHAIPMMSKSL